MKLTLKNFLKIGNLQRLFRVSVIFVFVSALTPQFLTLVEAGPVSSCPTGEICLMSDLAKSSGITYYYAFFTNDGDLSNNSYANECWSGCGFPVNDNNIQIRNRNGGKPQACLYRDFNFNGPTVGSANFYNSYWNNTTVQNQGSSILGKQGTIC